MSALDALASKAADKNTDTVKKRFTDKE